ncbi:MAG: hypothetical protein K8I02_01365, partial [Candidatus Methylomirabilis sp.]|nr:hypothetical protein [Deltaproteobacteria bacterium]
ALFRLPAARRRIPERILDALFVSRYYTFFAMKIVRPLRHVYRYHVRSVLKKSTLFKRREDLASAPVLEGQVV